MSPSKGAWRTWAGEWGTWEGGGGTWEGGDGGGRGGARLGLHGGEGPDAGRNIQLRASAAAGGRRVIGDAWGAVRGDGEAFPCGRLALAAGRHAEDAGRGVAARLVDELDLRPVGEPAGVVAAHLPRAARAARAAVASAPACAGPARAQCGPPPQRITSFEGRVPSFWGLSTIYFRHLKRPSGWRRAPHLRRGEWDGRMTLTHPPPPPRPHPASCCPD